MLNSALIGCFTVWLNVELCSDWLFHSAAHFSSSQEGNTGNIYISILSRAVIYIYFIFTFEILDHTYSLYYGVAVLTTHFPTGILKSGSRD